MKTPIVVYAGSDPSFQQAIADLAQGAGYQAKSIRRYAEDLAGKEIWLRFEETTSGFNYGGSDNSRYNPDDYRHFNAMLGLSELIRFLFNIQATILLKANGKEHVVEFRKNGDVGVGCTLVTSEKFEEIAARRAEVMK